MAVEILSYLFPSDTILLSLELLNFGCVVDLLVMMKFCLAVLMFSWDVLMLPRCVVLCLQQSALGATRLFLPQAFECNSTIVCWELFKLRSAVYIFTHSKSDL